MRDIEFVQRGDGLVYLILADRPEMCAAHDRVDSRMPGVFHDVTKDIDQSGVGASKYNEQPFGRIKHDRLIITYRIHDKLSR